MPNQNSGAYARYRTAAVEYLNTLGAPARKSDICRACGIPMGSQGGVFYGCDLFVCIETGPDAGLIRTRQPDELEPVEEQETERLEEPITEFTLDDLRLEAIGIIVGDNATELGHRDQYLVDVLLAGLLYELRTPINLIASDLGREPIEVTRWLYRKAVYGVVLFAEMEHQTIQLIMHTLVMSGDVIVDNSESEPKYLYVEKRAGSGPKIHGNLVNTIAKRWHYGYIEARNRLNNDKRLLGI